MFYVGMTALVLALALAGFLIYASRRPDTFRVARTTRVNAPAEAIFPLINDYRNWVQWSPYEHRDPALKRTFSGTASGRGASMPGRATRMSAPGVWRSSIPRRTGSSSSSTSSSRSRRTISPSSRSSRKGGATDVTWAMHGPVPFIGKIMHLIIDCDKMVGKDFAEGLASMKAAAERQVSNAA
jgi:hypothetical protein